MRHTVLPDMHSVVRKRLRLGPYRSGHLVKQQTTIISLVSSGYSCRPPSGDAEKCIYPSALLATVDIPCESPYVTHSSSPHVPLHHHLASGHSTSLALRGRIETLSTTRRRTIAPNVRKRPQPFYRHPFLTRTAAITTPPPYPYDSVLQIPSSDTLERTFAMSQEPAVQKPE